jgi:hypothetical protein
MKRVIIIRYTGIINNHFFNFSFHVAYSAIAAVSLLNYSFAGLYSNFDEIALSGLTFTQTIIVSP